MAQPAPTIRRITKRIGGTSEVVSATSVTEVLRRTNIGRVIKRMGVAPVHVPPVMGITPVTVGVASDGHHEHTEKHKHGQTFHGDQICVQRAMLTSSRISPWGFISPATSSRSAPANLRCRLVGEVGLEPTKAKPADLQSAPFAARDIPPAPSVDDRRKTSLSADRLWVTHPVGVNLRKTKSGPRPNIWTLKLPIQAARDRTIEHAQVPSNAARSPLGAPE